MYLMLVFAVTYVNHKVLVDTADYRVHCSMPPLAAGLALR